MDEEPSAFDVSKLPTIAKDDATVARKLQKAKQKNVCVWIHLFLCKTS